jgi:carbonic anhydrase/acetyltransferase-like protein (isoleucine patch superfamily)
MAIYALADADLEVEDENAFWVAPGAVLIGRIVLKKNASVWFGAVLRGDNEPIVVGENSNVQDGSVCHTDMGAPLTIGANVTVGHMAMLHGCTIGDNCLVGIKATVLNRANIQPFTLIGAHALVTENKTFPSGSLLTGSPAGVARELSEQQRAGLAMGAMSYVRNWQRFKAGLKPSRYAAKGG